MNAFFGALRKCERLLLVLLMILLIFVCAAQVFFRLVMHAPLAWTEEVARYAFVWLTFIGAAAVVGQWGHFQVDLIIGKLPPVFFKLSKYFAYVCIAFVAYIMVRHGWTLLGKVFPQRSAALLISMSYPYAALPLSGFLMMLHLVEHIVNDVRPAGADKAEA